MTYHVWNKMQDEKYGAGTVDLRRKPVYNESADREQYEGYKERLGDSIPGSFDAFQRLRKCREILGDNRTLLIQRQSLRSNRA